MDWFRMYSEFASDPKVQSMPEAMQRRLVMLLCLRCSNTLVTLHDDEICFALRISNDDLVETKALFIRKGFINEAWEIENWDKRQFVSDSSATRVARHRARKKEEVEEACNVTVTPQNRTDTEQIQNRTEKKKPSAKPTALPADEVAFELPLNDGSSYQLSKSLLADFETLYPSVNVDAELRACIGWNIANPTRRKTRSGILKHINSWLAEKQNKPAQHQPRAGPYQTANDKQKSFADRLTGRANDQRNDPEFIDIN